MSLLLKWPYKEKKIPNQYSIKNTFLGQRKQGVACYFNKHSDGKESSFFLGLRGCPTLPPKASVHWITVLFVRFKISLRKIKWEENGNNCLWNFLDKNMPGLVKGNPLVSFAWQKCALLAPGASVHKHSPTIQWSHTYHQHIGLPMPHCPTSHCSFPRQLLSFPSYPHLFRKDLIPVTLS